jgi:cell wall assembly regulator SMI1
MNSRQGRVLLIVSLVLVVVGGIFVAVVARQRPVGAEPTYTVAIASVVAQPPRAAVPYSPSAVPIPPPPVKPLADEVTGCHIGQGSAQVAAVPPAVNDRVTKAWTRIETWLAKHAPATYASLPPPADPKRIAEAQQKVGVLFPPELIASLQRHDGSGKDARAEFELPPFYTPISADEIGREAAMLCDVLKSGGIAGNVVSWWHGQYVPFAVDHSGEALFLDQRPGQNGRLAEHDNEGDVNSDRWPPTLTELLEATADGLETGKVVLSHYRALVTPQGTLDWDIR